MVSFTPPIAVTQKAGWAPEHSMDVTERGIDILIHQEYRPPTRPIRSPSLYSLSYNLVHSSDFNKVPACLHFIRSFRIFYAVDGKKFFENLTCICSMLRSRKNSELCTGGHDSVIKA
jgi:hypothetical protein